MVRTLLVFLLWSHKNWFPGDFNSRPTIRGVFDGKERSAWIGWSSNVQLKFPTTRDTFQWQEIRGKEYRPKVEASNCEKSNYGRFYSGWKKIHGLKYQTVDLPNGMNAHVYGPLSCRRNDLLCLGRSNLNEKLHELRRYRLIQYKVYGDSAYIPLTLSHVRARHSNAVNTPRERLENESMSSCRESIEWNYNDLKQYWKFIDFKKNLKLMDMPVVPITLCAMILRNAHTTMNGNTTSSYFECEPPSLVEWTSQGPRQLI